MSDYIMTAAEFVLMAKTAFNSERNIYCNSCFGSDLTNAEMLDQYTTETEWDRKHAAETTAAADAAKRAGVPLWGWDCVNLVKGLLWGWDGNYLDKRGGAKYQSNGVPDATIWDLYTNYCTDQSEDFSNILSGEFLVLNDKWGHCGIYIGDGLCIEATTKWESKVLISQVENLAPIYGDVNDRKRVWKYHARLPWIDYTAELRPIEPTYTVSIIKAECPCCHSQLQLTLNTTTSCTVEPAYRLHVVKDGESLWSIARDLLGNGERWREIAKLNGIADGEYIYTGQKLFIPLS